MRKIRASLKSSENHKITDEDSVVYVDEFVIGGSEKGKAGRNSKSKKRKIQMVVEATTKNKIKRVYGIKIDNYSSQELIKGFDKFIKKGTSVITDGWKAYNKMNDDYNIIVDSDKMKQNNNPMNRMNQQFKSWIRGIYHKSSHQHIEAYLNEFCFRINRSLWKEKSFHTALVKAMKHPPLLKNNIDNKCNYI